MVENFDEQVIKLTKAYYNTRQIYKLKIDIDEFLSCTFDYIYTHDLKSKYNPDKGALSSYIYSFLDSQKNVFIYSILHNTSTTETRRLFKHPEDVRIKNIMYPIYISSTDEDDDTNERIQNSKLSNARIVYLAEDKMSNVNIAKEFEQRQTIKEVLDFIDEKFINEKQREMLRYYILNYGEITQTAVAKKFNVSKQWFNHLLLKMRRLLKVDGIVSY